VRAAYANSDTDTNTCRNEPVGVTEADSHVNKPGSTCFGEPDEAAASPDVLRLSHTPVVRVCAEERRLHRAQQRQQPRA
jgi:hypothetical protein